MAPAAEYGGSRPTHKFTDGRSTRLIIKVETLDENWFHAGNLERSHKMTTVLASSQ
jgi:hypothetical protein